MILSDNKTKLDYFTECAIKKFFESSAEINYYPKDKCVTVKVTSYNNNGITYDMFKFLGDMFSTMKIHTDVYQTHGGCDTCDYGKNTEITFFVNDITLPTGEEDLFKD